MDNPMTDKQPQDASNHIDAMYAAGAYLIEAYKKLWNGGVVHDLPRAIAAWEATSLAARCASPRPLRDGMTIWRGGHERPTDYDGGPVEFRDGSTGGTSQLSYWHHTGGPDDIVAYTAADHPTP